MGLNPIGKTCQRLSVNILPELEHKVKVMQELLDRPDNAGAKFGYEQCAKLLQ